MNTSSEKDFLLVANVYYVCPAFVYIDLPPNGRLVFEIKIVEHEKVRIQHNHMDFTNQLTDVGRMFAYIMSCKSKMVCLEIHLPP